MKKRCLKLSLASFVLSAIAFVLNYVFYHYTGDDRANGIAFMFTPYHPEVQKPFITDLIGQLATLLLFLAIASLMVAFIFFGKEKVKKKKEEVDSVEDSTTDNTAENTEVNTQSECADDCQKSGDDVDVTT